MAPPVLVFDLHLTLRPFHTLGILVGQHMARLWNIALHGRTHNKLPVTRRKTKYLAPTEPFRRSLVVSELPLLVHPRLAITN